MERPQNELLAVAFITHVHVNMQLRMSTTHASKKPVDALKLDSKKRLFKSTS